MSDTNQRPPPPGKAESLFAAWAARIEAGERIEFESVVRRHPECARELEQLHDDWLQFAPLLSRVVPGLVASESGVLVPPLASAKDDDAPPSSDELFARLGLHGAGESRYRFRAVIGRGGGGVVLRVWDSKLNRALAMKVVLGREEERLSGDTPRVDGRTLSRFVDEARIAAQLNHPGIVPVHELGADDAGRAFFTMKLVKGEDLACIFEKVFTGEGDWNQPRALGYLLRVCEAMAYAHDKGVVHRDLKPANVMVGPYGEVHVMDWGLARVLGEKDTRDLRIRPQTQPPISAVDSFRAGERKAQADSPLITMDGAAVGTPAYMSPEQARGELEDVGPRSDVYAVGAMLYHLLTGEPPFTPRGAHVPQLVVLTNVMHGPPKPVEELSPRAAPELVAICEKAMQRQSTSRYGSMLELAADLRAFLEGRVVEAYETGTWAETKKWVQRNRALAASLLVTGLAVAGAVVALLWAFSQQKDAVLVAEQSAERERAAAERAQADEQRANQATLAARAAKIRADEVARAAEETAYVAAIVGAQSALNANEPANLRRLLDSAPERLRDWEWGYLNAVSDTSLRTLDGPDAPVNSASFSPDGTRVVTASEDGSVRVSDAALGVELGKIEWETWIAMRSAAFSTDGSRILAVGNFCALVLDSTGDCVVSTLKSPKYESLWFGSASCSVDGTRIVTAGGHPNDLLVMVWDAESGHALKELVGHAVGVWSATFSPDGTRVVSASDDGTARVWNSATGELIWKLEGHTQEVLSASFSPDGARIVTASRDRTAGLWDAATGQLIRKLEAHTDGVVSATFSPDGTRTATASWDNTACMWDAATGHLLWRFEFHTDWVSSATFSPDGTRIVTTSGDGTACLWDAATGELLEILRGHTDAVLGANFSADGARVVTASSDNTARVWDATSERARRRALMRAIVRSAGPSRVATSPDGKLVATSRRSRGPVWVWESASGSEIVKLEGHGDDVERMTFSRDGTRLLTASRDLSVRVWDVATGTELAELEGPPSAVKDLSFCEDGTRILGRLNDPTLYVWDAATGRKIANLEGITASLSPDGTRMLVGCTDGLMRVFDLHSGREIATLEMLRSSNPTACFSPDGRRILETATEAELRLWDAVGGRVVAKLEGHRSAIRSACFSLDGTRIVTASDDGTARVWDVATGRELALLEGHTDSVWSASFNADGSRIVTTSDDGSLRVWSSVGGRQLAKLKNPFGRAESVRFSADGTTILADWDWISRATSLDSVPYRERYAEHQSVAAARSAGERALLDALAKSKDYVEAGARLHGDTSLDPFVRRAATLRLSERCNVARGKARDLAFARAEREWIRRMLGWDRWTSESEAESALRAVPGVPADVQDLRRSAQRLVGPEEIPGDAMRAFVLARRAVAETNCNSHNWCLDTLARALFRLGSFDEALDHQRAALAAAPDGMKEEFDSYLKRLEADIAEWRDENGQLRVAKWTAKLEELDRQIAELEADPDVRMWLAYKR